MGMNQPTAVEMFFGVQTGLKCRAVGSPGEIPVETAVVKVEMIITVTAVPQ